jgi:hypothetical protein
MMEKDKMASNQKTSETKKPPAADLLRKMVPFGKSIPSRPSTH